jgi:hypothetical protein
MKILMIEKKTGPEFCLFNYNQGVMLPKINRLFSAPGRASSHRNRVHDKYHYAKKSQ